MKKSKYLGRVFDNGWVCTHVGVARVQPKFYKGTKDVSKRPGHATYYYIFERITSDRKAEKMIRLNCKEAAAVYRGEVSVENICFWRQALDDDYTFSRKVSYHFYD